MTNTATNLQMFETGSSTNFLDAVLAKHGSEPSALIPILQDIQENDRYLSQEAMDQVAHALDLSAATVYGVATFYAQFSLEPKGKYVVKVCDGTACHVRDPYRSMRHCASALVWPMARSPRPTGDTPWRRCPA